MAAKKRSGFMFMFIIILLLGVIIYTYRDKFGVLFNTGYTSSKDYIDEKFNKKGNDKTVTEKINLLERFKKGKDLKDKMDNIKENVNKMKDKSQESPLEGQKQEELVLKDENNKNNQTEKNKEIVKDEKKVIQIRPEEKKEIVEKEKTVVNNKAKVEKKLNNRTSKLYFTKIAGSEEIKFITVNRKVSYIDTPLTETLRSLLNGPSKEESTSSIITNIPGNTKLISVYIKDNTAFINLSKEFEYNSFGKESTLAQIKQLVFTATEFDSVKYVQILINGEVKKYLGGEGVMINKPYSRNDFS